MIVDLTNTDRYYSTSDFKKEGLKYLKIRCQGRDSVPDNESVNIFVFEPVSRLLAAGDELWIYCFTFTHTLSPPPLAPRLSGSPGFVCVDLVMIDASSFPLSLLWAMCWRLPMEAFGLCKLTIAIQRFAEARPPGIYKQDYIDALYAFYHETKNDIVVCPSTPEWKRSSDFDLNGEALPEDDDGNPYASTNEKEENAVLMTNDDVLGDKIPDHQEYQLQKFCCEILKTAPVRGQLQFPGSHPVSLDRDNLQLLRQRYYYATWKADGTRYMLLLCPDGAYLADRSFKFRRVQMRFPCKNMTELHHYTLLDGEMIIDTVSPQKQERRYLIYDLIAINRLSLAERPFYERWKLIEKEVVEPRNQERRNMDTAGKPYRYDLEPFRVRRKDFWLLSTVGKLLKEFIPNLSHEADGLVFQTCVEDDDGVEGDEVEKREWERSVLTLRRGSGEKRVEIVRQQY
ncbi:mRNA-capping enzyme [Bienertia sinuspersici]